MIGAGWYGKCDLYRLPQVAPIDVVAVCDVDKKCLKMVKLIGDRKGFTKEPRKHTDYRELLKEKIMTLPETICLSGEVLKKVRLKDQQYVFD